MGVEMRKLSKVGLFLFAATTALGTFSPAFAETAWYELMKGREAHLEAVAEYDRKLAELEGKREGFWDKVRA
jgi:hypothetical protein